MTQGVWAALRCKNRNYFQAHFHRIKGRRDGRKATTAVAASILTSVHAMLTQAKPYREMLRLPDSKTGKRDVVVSDEVMTLLGRLAQAKGNPRRGLVVCSGSGRKLHSLKITWPIVRKHAGIPDVRLHDLRHSVASDAIMDGVPLEVVGKMLGHRNYRTTQRYAHIADTALREAVNRTSNTIVRAARGKTKGQPRARRWRASGAARPAGRMTSRVPRIWLGAPPRVQPPLVSRGIWASAGST